MMEHTWDNQLDNMLDDLQASVHTNGTTVHNSGTSVQTHSGSSKADGMSMSSVEKSSRQYHQSSTINQTSYETHSEEKFYSSNNLISDLSSIQQVKSVHKSSESSGTGRGGGSSSSTQQSLKKNINDLDHLLSNLSTTEVKLQNNSEQKHGYDWDQKDDRREKLSLNNSFSRTREGSGRFTPREDSDSDRGQRTVYTSDSDRGQRTVYTSEQRTVYNSNNEHRNGYSTERVGHSPRPSTDFRQSPRPSTDFRQSPRPSENFRPLHTSTEFRPVHTAPDPLTGRYPDGRITPNHGYTKTFEAKASKSEMNNNGDIPKGPNELLHSFGENMDVRELEKIDQSEQQRARESEFKVREYEEGLPVVRGPPVFYPTEEMYQTKREKVFIESSSGGRGSKEKSESGGAAVIPICLPLCCAAPCVIM